MLVLLVGVVDYATGIEVSVTLFYLLPVTLGTWFAGRRTGLLLACASAIVWLVANVLGQATIGDPVVSIWNALVLGLEFGIVVWLLSALKDQQEHLEQTVLERTAQLRTTVEDLEHLSYSIIHDLRAPLRAVYSFATLLQRECGNCQEENIRDYVRRIGTAVQCMDHLIVDAFDYTKALRAELPLNPVDPTALLRSLLESYPAFQPAQADIRIAGRLPAVLANEAGLMQCFSNLLNNAVKFVAAGVVPQVQVSAEVRGDRVRLWFADNGIGIPAEHHERIFEIFQRLNNHYEGTGIGLALVRKVAQRLGGQVGVESEPGQGSRFWIELRGAECA